MSDFIRANNSSSFVSRNGSATYDTGLREYMGSVYNFMAIALAISGSIAYFISQSPEIMRAIFGTPLSWLFMLAPLGFVIFLGAKITSFTKDFFNIMIIYSTSMQWSRFLFETRCAY